MATDPYQAAPPPASELTSDAKTWGMLCHIAALAGYVCPFGNIIGPFVVWQLKKNEYPFVDDQGKESVNFQITITIASIVAAITFLIIIGIFLLPAVLLFGLVMIIVAAINANNGVWYRYPLTIRFIK